MPFQKILLQPGVDVQRTKTLNSGSWSTSNLIRWREGLLEKMGGWGHLNTTPIPGIVRGLHAFQDLNGIDYIAAGSSSRLELYTSGNLYDITPIRATVNIAVDFSTVISTTTVTIKDVAHGASAEDWINIVIPVSVGGIIIQGFYIITSIIDLDNYTITAGVATATVNNGGAVPVFTTVNTTNVVTVTFANHGYVIGNAFTVQVSTVVGGLTIFGPYLVDTVPTADTFTILTVSGATSSISGGENGGLARINYLIRSGSSSDMPVLGWGGGSWGSGAWGISSGTTAILPLRNWFLDNFGQNLVAVYTNGPLYQWVPPLADDNPATIVSEAPSISAGMFVAMPQAQVILLGTEVGAVQDSLLVRWCDNGDYSSSGSWTATSINQAGSYRLSKGSKIVGGIQAPNAGVIWTDTDVWLMQYIQQPFIYGFSIIGTGCGLLSPKGMTILAGAVYWISLKGIFAYDVGGSVRPVLCPVWDKIFGDLDTTNADKAFAASNSLFNEAMYFYPSLSGATEEIDSYVKHNVFENLWDYGSLVRTAWIDESVFGNPVGCDADGILQQHELGNDADGVAIDSFAQSGYMDLANGEMFIMINWLIPDFLLQGTGASVTVTLYAVDFPTDTPRSYGPFTVTAATQYINVRARARQIAIKIENDTLGTYWRIGAIRYRGEPAGRR